MERARTWVEETMLTTDHHYTHSPSRPTIFDTPTIHLCFISHPYNPSPLLFPLTAPPTIDHSPARSNHVCLFVTQGEVRVCVTSSLSEAYKADFLLTIKSHPSFHCITGSHKGSCKAEQVAVQDSKLYHPSSSDSAPHIDTCTINPFPSLFAACVHLGPIDGERT